VRKAAATEYWSYWV